MRPGEGNGKYKTTIPYEKLSGNVRATELDFF